MRFSMKKNLRLQAEATAIFLELLSPFLGVIWLNGQVFGQIFGTFEVLEGSLVVLSRFSSQWR